MNIMRNTITNRIVIRILGLLLVAAPLSSCNDGFLDTVPDNITDLDKVFSKKDLTIQWLNGIYYFLPDPWFQGVSASTEDAPGSAYQWAGMTDELDYSFKVMRINNNALTGDNSWRWWFGYYKGIRNAGIFIDNVHKNKELEESPHGLLYMRYYTGEARFLRAYYYFQLMKIYGPVPIIDPNVPEALAENYQLPRNSWRECVDFILEELDKAEQEVCDFNIQQESDLGRINNLIVKALRSQVLLFDASPLYNGNNQFHDLVDNNGRELLTSAYDPEKWKKAADEAMAVIDMAKEKYSLYETADADPFMKGYNSTKNLFWDGWVQEGIWIRPVAQQFVRWERYNSPRKSLGRGYSVMGVSQELVERFRMKDGSKFVYKANAGLTATAKEGFYRAKTSNMYVDREPRFYAYITFNGAAMPVKVEADKVSDPYVYYYNKGDNGSPTSAIDWPRTGYSPRKNIHPDNSYASPVVEKKRPAMLIRLAEIYLNYAEALNEYAPGSSDILVYLNKVRTRAGLPELDGTYSKDNMREMIHQERQLELCFEGQRYFDVRRWMTAGNVGSPDYQGGEMHGMSMSKGATFEDESFYIKAVATTRAPWHRRNYFWPISQADLERDTKLTQNPGY